MYVKQACAVEGCHLQRQLISNDSYLLQVCCSCYTQVEFIRRISHLGFTYSLRVTTGLVGVFQLEVSIVLAIKRQTQLSGFKHLNVLDASLDIRVGYGTC